MGERTPATSRERTTATARERTTATEVAQELVLLVRRLRARMRHVSTGDLTATQTSVLIRLQSDQASSTTLLAAAEGVRPQSMTATLNALHELGLIERRPDPQDGRRQIVTLNAAGAARVDDDRASRHGWLADVLAERLDAKQLRAVQDALQLLRDAVD